ncbi:hypothetical protein HHK36_017866 [Tetracentron sinense]|uniref:Hydroxyproline O-arabinosyltransferase-like domain-containing protein n=1 Tax=Tetracentron sinense TaxID=13715 RepID=A0A834Z0G1_TETSI|nr:hypothetical protein HHK36_017866 [Tetracentron sinense]
MIRRKKTGQASPLFMVLLALGFFFVTYNLLTMIIHNRSDGSGRWVADIVDSVSLTNLIIQRPENVESIKNPKLPFHVAVTATNDPYMKWQCRIMYYWYKKVKDMPGSEIGGFTRILSSGKPDNLMDEIPTFMVDPLPEGADRGEYPVGFPFSYIKPAQHERIIRRFYPEEKGPITDIDPIGNSPVIIKKSLVENIAPTWMDISFRLKDDLEADKTFGWVLEMYAYAIASALHGVKHILLKDFMIQDLNVGKKFIIHYTYGCDYSLMGELTYGKTGEWSFDKRSYLDGPPPRNLSLPPPGVPESVVAIVIESVTIVGLGFHITLGSQA